MRVLLTFLVVLLLLPALAQDEAVLTYPDSTSKTFSNPDQAMAGVIEFLRSSTQGRLSMRFRGKELVVVKKGTTAEMTFDGGETEIKDAKVLADELDQMDDPHNECASNLKYLAVALEMWASDNAGHYPVSLQAVTPDYLKQLPTCQGKDTYSAGYEASTNPDAFTLSCTGDHSAAGVPRGYPRYNSTKGLIRTP